MAVVEYAADYLVSSTVWSWTVPLEYEVRFTIPSLPAVVLAREWRMNIYSVPIDDPGHPYLLQDCHIDDVLFADDLPTTPTLGPFERTGPAPDLGTGTPSVIVRFPAPGPTTGYETAFAMVNNDPFYLPSTPGPYVMEFWYVLTYQAITMGAGNCAAGFYGR